MKENNKDSRRKPLPLLADPPLTLNLTGSLSQRTNHLQQLEKAVGEYRRAVSEVIMAVLVTFLGGFGLGLFFMLFLGEAWDAEGAELSFNCCLAALAAAGFLAITIIIGRFEKSLRQPQVENKYRRRTMDIIIDILLYPLTELVGWLVMRDLRRWAGGYRIDSEEVRTP